MAFECIAHQQPAAPEKFPWIIGCQRYGPMDEFATEEDARRDLGWFQRRFPNIKLRVCRVEGWPREVYGVVVNGQATSFFHYKKEAVAEMKSWNRRHGQNGPRASLVVWPFGIDESERV